MQYSIVAIYRLCLKCMCICKYKVIRDLLLSPQSVALLTSRNHNGVECTEWSQTRRLLDLERSLEKILSRLLVLQKGRLRSREREEISQGHSETAFVMDSGLDLGSPLGRHSPILYL